MSIIEGFGDEVIFSFVVLALIAILSLAWFSTDVRPVWNAGSIWLVQLQTHPNRRVLQVVSLDERRLDRVSENANTLNDSETQHIIVEQRNANDVETLVSRHENESVVISSSDESANQTSSVETANQFEPEDQTSNESTSPTSTIKLKFLDDTHKLVGAWLSQTVGQFKRQHFLSEVNQGKTVRLIYQGQLLREDGRTLESYGLHDNCVLHCHIGMVPYAQSTSASTVNAVQQHQPQGEARRVGNADIGQYVYLIFGIKFALLWLACYTYPQFFSTTSVLSLIMCTGLYLLFVYSGRRRNQQVGQPLN